MPSCKKLVTTQWVAIAIAMGSLATGRANADTEFSSHTVEAYGSTGMCAGDALTNANEDDDAFDNGFSTYDQQEHWSDAAVDGRDFADSVSFGWGDDDVDPYGTDWADVIFFSGHADSSCTSGSERSYLLMGDDVDGCNMNIAHASGGSRHATWGGTTAGEDAQVLVTFACETTQYCVYTAGAYDALSDSTGQFNLLNGFHGWVAEVSGYQSDLGSYSSDATNNYMGDAWLDWMYDPSVNGSGNDNCPSSIGYGANASERDDFFTYAGWLDFHDNGARTGTGFYKLCSCDPVGGATLPSC